MSLYGFYGEKIVDLLDRSDGMTPLEYEQEEKMLVEEIMSVKSLGEDEKAQLLKLLRG